jgi:hypothetical protein
MILGNIGNVFIVIIFNRQRQTACSIYLISSAVLNTVYLIIYGFFQLFPINYGDGTIGFIILCKIHIYIIGILGQEAKSMIILACVDRFLITSNRASFRAFSTPKRAKYLMFFSFIFWSLLSIHIPIMMTAVNGQCTISSGVYSIILNVYRILFISLIPPIISAIFGYLSYRNMRQMKNRVQPIGQNTINANMSIKRQDRDLLIIVIAEVVTYVITAALAPLIQLEMMISGYVMPNKSFQYLQIEIFILNIAFILLFVNSAAPFYTYLISSKSFRRDFKQLIINGYRKLRRQPPIQIVATIDGTLTQRETRV